jgi:hypothetical protein
MEEIKVVKRHKKTLKEYYADPEYKKKHMDKYKQKVKCTCGSMVSMYNLSHHKRTLKHLNADDSDDAKIKRIENELQRLKLRLLK